MTQDKHRSVPMASISGKRLEAAFDGGRPTSDGGLLLLRETEDRCGVINRIEKAIADMRHQGYVDHIVGTLLRQRVFQIACGYEVADDCDALRDDPGFKTACDRLPASGNDLASLPTMSRFGNRIGRSDLYRIAVAFVASYARSGRRRRSSCGATPTSPVPKSTTSAPRTACPSSWNWPPMKSSRRWRKTLWIRPQRVVCKAEAGDLGGNVRFEATSFTSSQPSFIYRKVY